MATIGQVAARAGVSKATVSRVVNESAPVAGETRRRVEAAVGALNYRPNVQAQQLAVGLGTAVAVVCDRPVDAFVAAVVHSLTSMRFGVTVARTNLEAPHEVAAVGGSGGVVVIGHRAEEALPRGMMASLPTVAAQPGPLQIDRTIVDSGGALSAMAADGVRRGGSSAILVDDRRLSNSAVVELRLAFNAVDIRLRRPMRQDLSDVMARRTQPDIVLAATAPIAARVFRQLAEARSNAQILTLESTPVTRQLAISGLETPYEALAESMTEQLYRQITSGITAGTEVRIPATYWDSATAI